MRGAPRTVSARSASSMMATPAASSTAPGDGIVLSMCAFTSSVCALLSSDPSETRTIKLDMP